MYKRKQKVTLSKGKLISLSSTMAIRHRNNEIVEKNNLSDDRGPRKNKKNPWPTNETGSTSPSWDGNSRATSSSWPEDIEEAATRKVLNLWCAIERTLYKEDEQVPLGNIMDECIQWRTQIPHFRVVGTKKNLEIEENDSEGGWSGEYKSHCSTDIRHIDHDNERNNSQQTTCGDNAEYEKQIIEKKEEVINRILEFICAELEKKMDIVDDNNDDEIESSCRNLDQVLTITPAPTYSGRRNFKSKKIIKSNSRMSSANKPESFQVTERRINIIASNKSRKNAKNAVDIDSTIDINNDDDDSETDESLQHVRNKPGTIFNEKIVVSPVPYAVTTRESFCTLKTTPIGYAGHLLELSTSHELNRNMNSASKLNSAHRISHLRVPQRHSAWQSSIYPMQGWTKNVRLTPIDPSRLPSSKKRSSTVSSSIPQRNRNSLSPISRPTLQTTTAPAFTSDAIINDGDFLKVHGKQIVTYSVKPNLLKTGLNQRPSIKKKKTISKSDR
ncbi:hypothetical protein PV326_002617 [Microctonus aethiopoides]|nr:hypothetical protein PV326_002617 [Microctonus aethiopoides]